ncbi:MAG: hypothetical protein EXR93_06750 [Gemmatimonadetes bacterium]|nr:hypothetical protein [Gemmatimonadota bacterium]
MTGGPADRLMGPMPRWVGWVLLTLATFAAAVAGFADAAMRTAAGRNIIVRAGLNAANSRIDGRLTVGQVDGSIRHGLEARDVAIEGNDGVELARVPELSIRYRLRDLLRGRIVLGQLTLSRPTITLVQQPGGRLNVEDILRLGKPRQGGRNPLVAFSDVAVNGGRITVTTFADSSARGEPRVRRFDGLNLRLGYLRLASPLAAERAIRMEVADMRVKMSDPLLDIRGGAGLIEIDGDSARVAMDALVLAGSRSKVQGVFSWHTRAVLFNLAVETKDASLDDVRGLAPKIHTGLTASGALTLRTNQDGTFEFQSDRVTVRGTGGGGSLAGRMGFVLGPKDTWGARGVDITLDNFDLEYVRPILDSMPLAGRLTGTLEADGPRARLVVGADFAFRDSLVAGWPETRIRATGTVGVGGPDAFTWRGVQVEQSRIDLATVRRLLPAVALRGILSAIGTMNGPWLEPEFTGTLRYRDQPLPVSVAKGVVRIDARRDTIGVWANLAWDSLNLAGFRTSYPGFVANGAFAGETRLSGYADSLTLTADLTGPPGQIVGGGALTLVGPHSGVHGLDLELRALSLDGLHPSLPPSRLFGRVTGLIDADTMNPPEARIQLALDSSSVAGSGLDSLRGTLTTVDSLLRIENLALWARAAHVSAYGGLGLGGSRSDSLVFAVELDAVAGVEPFARWLLALEPDTLRGGPVGAASVRGTLTGSRSAFRISGEATVPHVKWGTVTLANAAATGEWQRAERAAVRLDGTADSAGFAGFLLTNVGVGLEGRRDSLGWRFSSRMGDSVLVAAAGRAHRDSLALAVALDSLVMSLPVHQWRADSGAVVVWTDGSLTFQHTTLVSTDGGARLLIEGALPMAGGRDGKLHGSLELLPLKDLLAVMGREYRDVAGELSGTFDLDGSTADPVMAGAFSLVNGVWGEFRAPHVETTLNYAAHRLQGRGSLRRLGEHVLDLDVDLPLDLSLETVTRRQVDGALAIHAVADSVDLAFADALLRQVREASGQINADVRIAGSWARPELSGAVAIVNGAVSLPSVGVRYEAMNGRFALVGDTIRIDQLNLESTSLAVRKERGRLQVTGFLWLEEFSRPVVSLHFVTNEFHALEARNFLSAVATGELDLVGPVIGARLSGRGTMTKGVLYFSDLITKQVVNLQDTLFRDVVQDTSFIRRQGLGPAFHNVFWDSLTIGKVDLAMGSDVWLRSNEANIQLEGSVQVAKEANVYRLDGSLATPKGTYRLQLLPGVSREFTVVGGQVQYFWTPDLNAALNISAQHVVKRRAEANVTVSVNVAGTLYVPKLVLSSDFQPQLSDTEIISLLLFGTPRPEDVATAGTRSQADLAVAQLSGVLFGAGNTLVSNLGIPLDIQFRTSDVAAGFSGSEIAVGKQLMVFGTTLFLNGSLRGCPGSVVTLGGASLEFRMTREWRVAASLEPTGTCQTNGLSNNAGRQAGVDLFWEKKF